MRPNNPGYHTLRDGKLIWICDDEPTEPMRRKVRSRLETDQELRKRVIETAKVRGVTGWDPVYSPNTLKHLSGDALDEQVSRYFHYDLTQGFIPFKREIVDEIEE